MLSGCLRDVCGAFALASALCGSQNPQNFTEITRPTVKSLTVPLLSLAEQRDKILISEILSVFFSELEFFDFPKLFRG